MSPTRRWWAALLLTVLACAAPSGEPEIGARLYYAGGEVTVQVLQVEAAYTSELRLPDLTSGRPEVLSTNRELGREVTFDPSRMGYAVGAELVFEIRVVDTGDVFRMGPSQRNPDGLAHARVRAAGAAYDVGFEDVRGGGDLDYDDNVFRFTGRLMVEAADRGRPVAVTPGR